MKTSETVTLETSDPSRTLWRKSSYSGGSGNCVEVALDPPGQVRVRDSKVPDGTVLILPAGGFADFLTAVNQGAIPLA
ncbi:DUF397 domain-containing protein [Streptomyces sp. NPDC056672]|uniref:DUF397 domain-containing protein n=1 Tax=Streptomyces sp. NPDC056672 TaxID=3345906 RepID=UPI00367AFDA0